MGSESFFSRLAGDDKLAGALNLPGANKYNDILAIQRSNGAGPYAGVTPTLAAANAGYAPGGAGAKVGWTDTAMPQAPAGIVPQAQKPIAAPAAPSTPLGTMFSPGGQPPRAQSMMQPRGGYGGF